MRKNGFTLIELLAVIVILAIIALIAAPIVLNIIEQTNENASKRSVDNYLRAVELAVANKNMKMSFNPTECYVYGNNLQCGGIALNVKIDGQIPKSGIITFENGKINGYKNLYIGDKYISKTGDDVTVKYDPLGVMP